MNNLFSKHNLMVWLLIFILIFSFAKVFTSTNLSVYARENCNGECPPLPDDYPPPILDCPPNCPPVPNCVGGTSVCGTGVDGGGGGGGTVASMFYCDQTGSPTGINVIHQGLTQFQMT